MLETQDPELLAEFVSESLQGLKNIEQDLLSLEGDGEVDVDLVNRIFRAVHSIKGAGSFMALDNLVKVAHRGETLLDYLRSGKAFPTAEVTDAVLACNDALTAMLQESDMGASFNCIPVLDLLDLALNGLQDCSAAKKPEKSVQQMTAAKNVESNETQSDPEEFKPSIDDQDPELIAEFVSEALQGLRAIEQDLLSLESAQESDKELVNRIFRAVHTIKGNGSFLGLDNLVAVSHRAETLLDDVRNNRKSANASVADAVLAAIDSLNVMLQMSDLGASYDCACVLQKLDLVMGSASQTDTSDAPAASADDTIAIIRKKANQRLPVYAIKVDLAELHHSIDTKEGILDGLKSVGSVLHASIPIESIETQTSGTCVIFYETVLEPDLISLHFGVPGENIVLLNLKSDVLVLPFEPKPQSAIANPQATATPTSSGAVRKFDEKLKADEAAQVEPEKAAPAKEVNQTPKSAPPAAAVTDQTMRVPVRILEELLRWTGNMVMARDQLMNEFDFSGSSAFHTLSQAITGVHETVIETRMQTTGSLFERYRRVVRDLSRQLKKEVAFHIEGGDLELDRTILESFADPLTHLVRNCCDHALETPAEREKAGKNRQGNVYLRSYVQSGEIILEVQDDGRGISGEHVSRKAVEKGIISAEEAANMSDDQKIMLIFAAGFSTKDTATDVSGRGVGMDVVRNNIEKVGGTIEVRTKMGEGSVFAARLPLAKALVSSSLTAALIIEVDGEKFAVPETAVSEIIRCDSKTSASIHQVDGRDVFQLRDQLIALIDLRTPLELADEATCDDQNRLANIQPGDSRCLVILQYRNHLFGTIVDNVIGIQEIIVRSTPKLLADCTVYSGHTVLGTGRVALILDVNGIVTKMGLEFNSRAKKASQPQNVSRSSANAVPDAAATQKMLLFNYSAKEFFAIPLELVALIERVSKKDLQLVGVNEFCQFKSETISVMRLDNFLPITKLDPHQQDFCLIRPAAIEYPIGILTGLDVSVLEVADNFETRLDDSQGVVGTFMHQDRLVMMLDLFSIFEKHAPEKLRVEDDSNQKANILIAEDSLFFRKLVAQYIQKPNWTVDIVNDGLEAWEKLQNNPTRYKLVISDINMPRMDGFELAVKVREDKRFDAMPMVALTTMSDEHFRKKGLSLGFDRYVIKIDKREVRSTVAECLRIKRHKKG